MSDEPHVRNRVMWYSGLASAVLLLAGTACADEVDKTLDSTASRGYADSEYYGYPGYGALGYLDPGYAFTLAAGYGNPAYDIGGDGMRGYGWGGYGYPGYGLSGYGYPGYGLDTRSYDAPSSSEQRADQAADRRYIRQLEERIKKLENANQQALPPYSERSAQPAVLLYSGNQPAYEAPAAGYPAQSDYHRSGSQSQQGIRSEYPTYQPSYGSPPKYQFKQ